MKVAIFVDTPARVHFYKNIVNKLIADGHNVILLLRDYGDTTYLADKIGFKYTIYSAPLSSKSKKILYVPYEILVSYSYLRRFKPDIIIDGGLIPAYASFLLRKPFISFNDGELNNSLFFTIEVKLYLPLIKAMLVPDCFLDDIGKKQIRVKGFKELAYLHPNRFIPNENILDLLGITKDTAFALLRFNAFDAVHDITLKGFSSIDKINLVKELEKYMRVFISSEGSIPEEIKDRIINVPKERIHDVISYANLLIADAGTMVSEAAVLGVPAILCNSNVYKFGVFKELDETYGLIFRYDNPKEAIKKAIDLSQNPKLKEEWRKKRETLLKEKIDVAKFMIWLIENYPKSLELIQMDANHQDMFMILEKGFV